MKLRTLPVLPLLLLLGLFGCAKSHTEKWDSLKAEIATATDMAVYRGLPHPRFDNTAHLRARNGSVKDVPGWLAFPEPLTVSDADRVLLTRTVLSICRLERYVGPYKDAGFWPAYSACWNTADGLVKISFSGSVLLAESKRTRIHFICHNAALCETLAAIFARCDAADTQRLVDSIYGTAAQNQNSAP